MEWGWTKGARNEGDTDSESGSDGQERRGMEGNGLEKG